jgi:hypothetical protein
MSFEKQMSDNDIRSFIAEVELADSSRPVIQQRRAMSIGRAKRALVTENAVAAVVGSNLLAFAEGVSRQNKEDVMDSFLFATLVANKAFNPETQSVDWYSRFYKVLSTVGWLSTSWNYERYQSNHQRFTMEQAGLEILASAIAAAALPGPASVAMLKVAGDAVKALAAKEKPLGLFERQTKSHNGASFRIGACAESQDGTVNLAMGAVNFEASSTVTDVLFWEWNSSEVKTFRGEDSLVLNTRLYAGHRELIQQRLGTNAQTAIAEFDI